MAAAVRLRVREEISAGTKGDREEAATEEGEETEYDDAGELEADGGETIGREEPKEGGAPAEAAAATECWLTAETIPVVKLMGVTRLARGPEER